MSLYMSSLKYVVRFDKLTLLKSFLFFSSLQNCYQKAERFKYFILFFNKL